MFVYIILTTLILIILPDTAFAWGPGTHLETAMTVLERLALVAPAVRAIIAAAPDAFLYGAVHADVVVGKKRAGHKYYCHTWQLATKLIKRAKTPTEKAAAYGHLCHMAADVVAHNLFVPYKIIYSYDRRLLRHTYWEMRFDLHVKPSVWKKMGTLLKSDFKSFDQLLARSFNKTLFSFPTNRRIFRGILRIQKGAKIHAVLKSYARHSAWTLPSGDIKKYRGLIEASVFDFLKNGFKSNAMHGDPSGSERIAYAKEIRKKLKKLARKQGKDRAITSLIKTIHDRLEKNMYKQSSDLPLINI